MKRDYRSCMRVKEKITNEQLKKRHCKLGQRIMYKHYGECEVVSYNEQKDEVHATLYKPIGRVRYVINDRDTFSLINRPNTIREKICVLVENTWTKLLKNKQ